MENSPIEGGFGCLELCLYDIMIPTNQSTVYRPMRVDQPACFSPVVELAGVVVPEVQHPL